MGGLEHFVWRLENILLVYNCFFGRFVGVYRRALVAALQCLNQNLQDFRIFRMRLIILLILTSKES
jgi:hypothetical protein